MKLTIEIELTGILPQSWSNWFFPHLREYWCVGLLRATGAWAIAYFFGVLWLAKPHDNKPGRLYGISRTKYIGQPTCDDPCGTLQGVRWEIGNKVIERFTTGAE